MTGARSDEARGCTWDEIDLDSAGWVQTASRTKQICDHRVPLSRQARHMLLMLESRREGPLVFPGRNGAPLAGNTLARLLPKTPKVVLHGFRTSFVSWAKQETSSPREMLMEAISHVIGSGADRAYDRHENIRRGARSCRLGRIISCRLGQGIRARWC